MVWRMDAEAAAADSQQRNSHSHSQAAHPTGPAYAAAAGPTPERSADPASRLRLFEEIKQKNLKRGGLRTDARGNVRLRCPWCEHKSNSFVWNAEHHGGCFQCFHCNEKGGWKKLAQQYGILKRRDPEHRTDAAIFREWQHVALTAFDWRGLVKRFGTHATVAEIRRAATGTARAYLALCEIAARRGTAIIPASTRTLCELGGLSTHSLVLTKREAEEGIPDKALWLLRAAGLIRCRVTWQERTRSNRRRRAATYTLNDLRRAKPEFCFLDAPERSEASPIPETSSGALRKLFLPYRRFGIPHAARVILAHLDNGPQRQVTLAKLTRLAAGTVSKSLRKLAELGLVEKHGREWQRTAATVAEAAQAPAFDKARAAAKRQRIRHQVERERFDNTQLPAVLEGASKATAAPKKLVMTPYQHQAGPQTHQERAGATNAGKDGRPYAPTRKGFSAATHMRL